MPVKSADDKGTTWRAVDDVTRADFLQRLNTLGQGAIYHTPEGVILAANPAAAHLLGFTCEDLPRHNIHAGRNKPIYPDGSPIPFEQLPFISAARTGAAVINAIIGISPQHSPRTTWLQVSSIPEYRDEHIVQVLTVFSDVTAQHEAEYQLNERRKELQAFFSLSELAEIKDLPLSELYRRVIDFLPKSWQYPDVAYGRIVVNDQVYQSTHYADTPWKQTAKIFQRGLPAGFIEIGYLAERPVEDEGPFLKEEHQLLDAMAERIGRIIERKASAEALAASEERFRTLIENAPLPIAISRDEVFTYVNKEFVRAFGYNSAEELIGKYFYEMNVPEIRQELHAVNLAWLRGLNPSPYHNERECVKKDGTHFNVYVNLQKITLPDGPAVLSFYHDITERKQAEQELEKYQAHLEELVRELTAVQKLLASEKELLSTTLMSIGDGVIVTNPDGRITLLNHAAEKMTGFSLEEARTRPLLAVFQLLDSQSQEPLHDPIHTLIEMDKAQMRNTEYRVPILVTRSGSRLLVLVNIAVLQTYTNEAAGYVITFQDITEKQRQASQSELSKKMEAIGQLAAGIAHEINTPIQYVGDNLKFLNKAFTKYNEMLAVYEQTLRDHLQTTVSAELLEQVEEIRRQKKIAHFHQEIPNAIAEALDGTERVRKIVMAMREFSHPSERVKKLADLNHSIETTIAISRNEWKYHAEMRTDFDPDLPPVFCQIDEISQVILNMIINAAQAIQEKNQDKPGTKGEIVISTRQEHEQVLISIRDTGPGIPEAIRERIFDPFFTTKGVGKGTGQGLSLAHNIVVNRHHGKILVDSEVQKGTTFTIVLPIHSPENETA